MVSSDVWWCKKKLVVGSYSKSGMIVRVNFACSFCELPPASLVWICWGCFLWVGSLPYIHIESDKNLRRGNQRESSLEKEAGTILPDGIVGPVV